MTEHLPRLARRTPAPPPGIVHLGLGAFFRSFGLPMIEEAISAKNGAWGVIGVSLRSPDIKDKLTQQSCVYQAVEMGATDEKRRCIGVLSDVLFAPQEPDVLLSRMVDPAIKIVSLTVTEKGYCHIPSTGMLDINHPDIQHDINAPTPRTAIGYIVRALHIRHQNGHRPLTVMSCDNLPDNGRVVHNVVTGLAALTDKNLADWIAREVCFPSTMVDRIVPATTDEQISGLAAETECLDTAPVFHEPFRQWVIEDRFVDGQRPAFEHVDGIDLVSDVAPFELMKIRMLNGTHSALAYLGYLAGHETISETVNDPVFHTFVQKLWTDEIIPTLVPPENTNLHVYAEKLLDRYSNPSIRHKTWQIAMDGSQKLPQRILGTIRDNEAAGRSSAGLILAVAAWMRYIGGTDENARPIDVRDPMSARLRALTEKSTSPDETIENLLTVKEVFGSKFHQTTKLAIVRAYEGLIEHGAKESVQRCVLR